MTLTEIIIAVVVALILAIDGILLLTKGRQATISSVLLAVAKAYPVIPFLIGFAMGHIFWVNQ